MHVDVREEELAFDSCESVNVMLELLVVQLPASGSDPFRGSPDESEES